MIIEVLSIYCCFFETENKHTCSRKYITKMHNTNTSLQFTIQHKIHDSQNTTNTQYNRTTCGRKYDLLHQKLRLFIARILCNGNENTLTEQFYCDGLVHTNKIVLPEHQSVDFMSIAQLFQ